MRFPELVYGRQGWVHGAVPECVGFLRLSVWHICKFGGGGGSLWQGTGACLGDMGACPLPSKPALAYLLADPGATAGQRSCAVLSLTK